MGITEELEQDALAPSIPVGVSARITQAARVIRAQTEALEAYVNAFDAGTGTVYVEPVIRAAIKLAQESADA